MFIIFGDSGYGKLHIALDELRFYHPNDNFSSVFNCADVLEDFFRIDFNAFRNFCLEHFSNNTSFSFDGAHDMASITKWFQNKSLQTPVDLDSLHHAGIIFKSQCSKMKSK